MQTQKSMNGFFSEKTMKESKLDEQHEDEKDEHNFYMKLLNKKIMVTKERHASSKSVQSLIDLSISYDNENNDS